MRNNQIINCIKQQRNERPKFSVWDDNGGSRCSVRKPSFLATPQPLLQCTQLQVTATIKSTRKTKNSISSIHKTWCIRLADRAAELRELRQFCKCLQTHYFTEWLRHILWLICIFSWALQSRHTSTAGWQSAIKPTDRKSAVITIKQVSLILRIVSH